MKHRLFLRLGRRGICLVLIGLVFFFQGLGNFLARNDFITIPRDGVTYRTFRLATEIAPFGWWGIAFMIAGIIAIISSQWPPGKDVWGWAALTFMSTVWSGVYISGWIFYGANRAWVGGALFVCIAAMTQVLAGWPEDPTSYHEHLKGEGTDG